MCAIRLGNLTKREQIEELLVCRELLLELRDCGVGSTLPREPLLQTAQRGFVVSKLAVSQWLGCCTLWIRCSTQVENTRGVFGFSPRHKVLLPIGRDCPLSETHRGKARWSHSVDNHLVFGGAR